MIIFRVKHFISFIICKTCAVSGCRVEWCQHLELKSLGLGFNKTSPAVFLYTLIYIRWFWSRLHVPKIGHCCFYDNFGGQSCSKNKSELLVMSALLLVISLKCKTDFLTFDVSVSLITFSAFLLLFIWHCWLNDGRGIHLYIADVGLLGVTISLELGASYSSSCHNHLYHRMKSRTRIFWYQLVLENGH